MVNRETCFCWCFWDLEVPYSDIAAAGVEDIVLRAMDEAMNIQPRDMYWSVLGMMNNPWFRVALRKETLENGTIKIRFEHPTQPALMKGGWMDRVKKNGGDLTGANWGERDSSSLNTPQEPKPVVETVKMTNDSISRTIEIAEFLSHSSKECGAWFVVEDEVYTGTPFLSAHPGGEKSILVVGGTDCTEEFQAIHSETAKNMMPKYHVGTLSTAAKAALANAGSSPSTTASTDARPIFLEDSRYINSKLLSKEIVSHDTVILRFALDHPSQVLGLPVGQHIMIKTPVDGKAVIRAYTPISHTAGSLDLLIKVYRDLGVPGQRGGVMSQALDRLQPGIDSVAVKGPVGRFTYLPPDLRKPDRNNVEFVGVARKVNKFLMVCAGTGITPIYQVLEAVAAESADSEVRCFVAYGNRNEDDMLCRDELDRLFSIPGARQRIQLVHTLSGTKSAGLVATAAGAPVRKGRVSLDLVTEGYKWLTEGTAREVGDMMVLLCGPEGLENGVKQWVGQRASEWGLRVPESKGEDGDLCIF